MHCTQTKTSSIEDSCLTERWRLEYETKRRRNHDKVTFTSVKYPILRHYDVSCIHDRVYVVEESPGLHGELGLNSDLVVLVKKKETWKNYFTET
jgi:hypothetical protein